MWNNSEAKRRANEISTCLIKFIALKQKYGVTEFIFYFDNYGGQNWQKKKVIHIYVGICFIHFKN